MGGAPCVRTLSVSFVLETDTADRRGFIKSHRQFGFNELYASLCYSSVLASAPACFTSWKTNVEKKIGHSRRKRGTNIQHNKRSHSHFVTILNDRRLNNIKDIKHIRTHFPLKGILSYYCFFFTASFRNNSLLAHLQFSFEERLAELPHTLSRDLPLRQEPLHVRIPIIDSNPGQVLRFEAKVAERPRVGFHCSVYQNK